MGARPRLRSQAAKATRYYPRPVEEVHRGNTQGTSSCRVRPTTTQTLNAYSARSPGSVRYRVSKQQLLSRGEIHSIGVRYHRAFRSSWHVPQGIGPLRKQLY
ncbi:Uncharacterized protein HZ326_22705 [Fusarium oxysporum f. sp. albedinis]|nr:Uncharacterized protein HZ326_22705 [Fusarium oxysporum f. sp. albedinis]